MKPFCAIFLILLSGKFFNHTLNLLKRSIIEFSEYEINVYEIRPGIIQTDMTAVVKEKYDKLIAEGLVPQKRWGYPKDIGKAVVGLAKGYFDYSTGLVVEVSGGMDIQRL